MDGQKLSKKMQQDSVTNCLTAIGNNPTPELAISSYIYMIECLSALYVKAFEDGYRQRDAEKIIEKI